MSWTDSIMESVNRLHNGVGFITTISLRAAEKNPPRPLDIYGSSTVPYKSNGNDITNSGQHGALSLTSVVCLCFPVWRESVTAIFRRADGSRLCCCAIKFSFRIWKNDDSRCPCRRSRRRCRKLGSPIARSRRKGSCLKLPLLVSVAKSNSQHFLSQPLVQLAQLLLVVHVFQVVINKCNRTEPILHHVPRNIRCQLCAGLRLLRFAEALFLRRKAKRN